MKNVDIRLLASRVAYIIAALLSAGSILIACLGAVSCSTDQVSTEKEQTTVDILKTAMEYIKINHLY